MGATAAIAAISQHFTGTPVAVAGVRNKVMQTGRAFKDQIEAATQVPTLPPPPSIANQNATAGQAAAQAAALARRRAASAGGFASTILTPPTIGQAPTMRKTLLGQ